MAHPLLTTVMFCVLVVEVAGLLAKVAGHISASTKVSENIEIPRLRADVDLIEDKMSYIIPDLERLRAREIGGPFRSSSPSIRVHEAEHPMESRAQNPADSS